MSSIKRLRVYHRYLSCFIAPIILFYCASGVFLLLKMDKGADTSLNARAYYNWTKVHKSQRFSKFLVPDKDPKTSKHFVYASVIACVLVLIVTLTGVALAFAYTKSKVSIFLSLILGILIPLFCLWLGGGTG